jgi:hypothetical protein
MDLRVYYQRIRETREKLADKDIVVISCETQDGGKAGVCAEVPRDLAAKMLVDGTVALANDDVAAEFRRGQVAAKEEADRELAATKIPLTVVPTAELNWLRSREQD